MVRSMWRVLAIGLGSLVLLATSSRAAPITFVNGNFESGTLAGWTQFTTPHGTIGPPTVVPFDVTGTGATRAGGSST